MKKLVSLKELSKIEKQLQEERKVSKELRAELDKLKEDHELELSNIMDQENEEREKLDEDIVLLQNEKIKLEGTIFRLVFMSHIYFRNETTIKGKRRLAK